MKSFLTENEHVKFSRQFYPECHASYLIVSAQDQTLCNSKFFPFLLLSDNAACFPGREKVTGCLGDQLSDSQLFCELYNGNFCV